MMKSTTLKPTGVFKFPEGLGIFPVEGDCMSPAIRSGQRVFAVKCDSRDIAPDTPVIILVGDRKLCKLWAGQANREVLLRFLNDGQGRSGTIAVPADQVRELWVVCGIWFGDVPMRARQDAQRIPILSPEQFHTATRDRIAAKRSAKLPALEGR